MNNELTFTPPMDNVPKPCCRKCGTELTRIPRTIFMKTVLFWLPVKNYICYCCLRKQWRIVNNKKSRL